MIRIAIEPDGQSVAVSLTRFLGDRFRDYLAACSEAGARYVQSRKCNVLPVSGVPALLAALSRAQLPIEVAPELAEALAAEAAEATALLSAGRERLDAIRAGLRPGLRLYRYQETGVEWLSPRKRALLADSPGLGKTAQALLAAPADHGILVVAPAAVRAAWAQECMTWRPDLRPVTVTTGAQFRWPRKGECVIATYGLMPADAEDLGLPGHPVCAIVDEAHALKNPKAARTKRWRAIARVVADCGGRTWLLTGTPLLNRPPELWAVLQAASLAEEAFGSWAEFVRMFSGSKGRFGYAWGEATEDAPLRLQRVSLHRRREAVLADLPTKRHRDVPVTDLDTATVALCDEAWAALQAAGVDLADAEALAKATTGGVAFELMSRARAALATAKIGAMNEWLDELEEAEEPAVVFSMHLAPVLAAGKRPGWAIISGDVPADERGAIVASFQRGELKGIAGTIGAMGVGVTLTRAAHAILVDRAFTPALNAQAEDRLVRIGQTRGVLITRLIAAHRLDERVAELLSAKQEVIESSVGASAVEAEHVGDAPAVALAEAAETARRLADEGQQRAEDQRAREQAETDAEVAAMRERLGSAYDGRPVTTSVTGNFRSAANETEAAAGRVLLIVAGMDGDHAAVRNGVGFSRNDQEFGHSLATNLRKYGRLSEKQWGYAVKLASRYHRQVETEAHAS